MKRTRVTSLLTARLTTALALVALGSNAANRWWDPVPANPGPDDGNGTWSAAAANTNWWNGAENAPWVSGDTAVFGLNSATNVTVTLTNSVTAGGIVFSNAGLGIYTVIGGAAGSIPLAFGTNLTLAGASPTVLLAAHDVTQAQVVDVVSASVIAPNGLSVRAATAFTNGFVRFGNATNYIVGSLAVGTPGNATYGGSTALYCDFNTPTDSAAVGINFLLTGATNVTVYSNATFRISNQNGSQWNPAFPKNLTLSGDGRNGMNGAWVITGNGNGIFNGNVILAGDSTIEINSGTAGRTYTLNQPISGAGRLQVVCGSAGKHTLQLTNASLYAGNTVIAGGTTLRLQSGNDRLPVTTALTLGAQSTPVVNWNREGSLILGNTAAAVTQTLAGLRSDAGSLDNLCRVIGGNATNASWLTVNNTGSNYYGGAIGGTAAADRNLGLVINGGSLLLAGANLANGGFTFNGGGTLQFGDGFSDYSLAGNITNSGTVVFNVAGTLAYGDVLSGAGSLLKRGGGAATLAGTNTYTGTTTIEAGKLSLPTSKTGTGAILAAGTGAELEVKLTPGAATLTAASAALDSATLDFHFNLNSPGATAPLTVTGTFTNSGYTTVNVLGFGPLTLGSFPLVKYGTYRSNDFSSFNLNPLGAGVTAIVQDNPANKSIDLVITALNGLRWTGATDTNWDTTTINWVNTASGTPSTYASGSFALFDDSGTNTALWLLSDPQPTGLTVSNNAKAYSFNGYAGIGGPAALVKQGSGTLTVAVNNFNSGGTVIQKGIVQVGDGAVDGAIAAPIVDNGALVFNVLNAGTASGIAGTGTVAKAGSGQLTLGGGSTFTGATTVQQGRLFVTDSSALGATNSGTTVQWGSELWVDAPGLIVPEPLTLGGVGVDGSAGAFNATANAAGSTWSGKITVTTNTVLTAVSGASLTFSGGLEAGTNTLLFAPNNAAYFNSSSNVVARAVQLNGTGGLLLSAANPGLTNIQNLGPVTSGSSPPITSGVWARHNLALGTNSLITLTNGSHIGDTGAQLGLDNNVTIPAGVSLAVYCPGDGVEGQGGYRCSFSVRTSTTNTWNGPIVLHGADPALGVTPVFILNGGNSGTAGRLVVNGNITAAEGVVNLVPRGWGSGQFNGHLNLGTNLFSLTDGAVWTVNSSGNIWGVTQCGGGGETLLVGTNNALCTNAPVWMHLNSPANTLDLGGFNQQVGGLFNDGTGAATIRNSSTNTASTLRLVSNSGANWVYDATLTAVAGAKGLNLDLTGDTLTLTATGNTYAGSTTIRSGATLALSGNGAITATTPIDVRSGGILDVTATASGALTLGATQTLAGNGTVNGSLGVAGTVAPGESVGTLTVSGDVTNTSTATMLLEVDNAAGTNDLLSVGGKLTYAGKLMVKHLSSTPYTNGQVLKLFSAGSYAGFFDVIVVAEVVAYDASRLAVDGTLKVVTAISTTLAPITYAVTGGGTSLNLAWPYDHTGWRLQAQTNSLATGITGTWHDVTGSTGTNQMTIPINAANPTVFFRLIYP